MSSHEQALVSLASQLALSFDGAVLGVALAYAAVRSIVKFASASKSLRKIRSAPTLSVSDLRSVIRDGAQDQAPGGEDNVVIVRGHVDAKSAVDTWKNNLLVRSHNNSGGVLVSHQSGDKAVILQRTQTVPFILVEGGQSPVSDYVVVNMDGSRHPLPLTTVYHQLQPVDATPYTFLQALFGHEYPVGLLDEEKILPLGKSISAVGVCNFKNGIPEIKSCEDLPYFLSDMTKDQILSDLAFKTKMLMWSGIILGSLSIGILGYAVVRNWNRWKEWRQQQRQAQEPSDDTNDQDLSLIEADDDTGEVPDGQLCVICLMRRRRAAFIPCGHLVCCQLCAISVEREVSPKCPLCRQAIRNSIRIFDS
ncbi:hypothetical protein Tsubulata_028212 [Turnera subulata]|uniref:RING-type E3 ubiquitin transferase n=1 Tax=Turnera subulata TaxID=218843 RepID=A0A9Q0J9P1_9ROSI|nr:hypothetical protein Tsubulata_028212 [Turnera subulata]